MERGNILWGGALSDQERITLLKQRKEFAQEQEKQKVREDALNEREARLQTTEQDLLTQQTTINEQKQTIEFEKQELLHLRKSLTEEQEHHNQVMADLAISEAKLKQDISAHKDELGHLQQKLKQLQIKHRQTQQRLEEQGERLSEKPIHQTSPSRKVLLPMLMIASLALGYGIHWVINGQQVSSTANVDNTIPLPSPKNDQVTHITATTYIHQIDSLVAHARDIHRNKEEEDYISASIALFSEALELSEKAILEYPDDNALRAQVEQVKLSIKEIIAWYEESAKYDPYTDYQTLYIQPFRSLIKE